MNKIYKGIVYPRFDGQKVIFKIEIEDGDWNVRPVLTGIHHVGDVVNLTAQTVGTRGMLERQFQIEYTDSDRIGDVHPKFNNLVFTGETVKGIARFKAGDYIFDTSNNSMMEAYKYKSVFWDNRHIIHHVTPTVTPKNRFGGGRAILTGYHIYNSETKQTEYWAGGNPNSPNPFGLVIRRITESAYKTLFFERKEEWQAVINDEPVTREFLRAWQVAMADNACYPPLVKL